MPRAPDLVRHRLRNQRLTGPGFSRPEEVVSWLGAVQSQDYPGARWSVGQRVAKGTGPLVDEAFNQGRILRTHLLRPTWHFVSPADIRWMLELTAPHIQRLNACWYRVGEVDQPLVRRVRGIVERELEGGIFRTREQLQEVLARAGIMAEKMRLAALMMHLELDRVIVSGPMLGKRHTYALLDERAPATTAPISRDEALSRLAHRFFMGHGPATVRHLAWWSQLTLRDSARGIAATRHQLSSRIIDGVEWFGFADPAPRTPVRGALLVPEYDEALVGARDLPILDLPHAKKRWTDTFLRPILIDGQRAGTWRRRMKGEVGIDTNLFARLDSGQHARLAAAVRRYGAFAGMP